MKNLLIMFTLFGVLFGCKKKEPDVQVEYKIITPSRTSYRADYYINGGKRSNNFIGDTTIAYMASEGDVVSMRVDNVRDMTLELYINDELVDSDVAVSGTKESLHVSK